MARGKVARMVNEAVRRGWRIEVQEHDRAITREVYLPDGTAGRLRFTRAGVYLEVRHTLAAVPCTGIPTPDGAARIWQGAAM